MGKKESDTRDRILKAACQEFLEKGYQDAWLRGIAKNAGVTTGALYGYFKNKEELFGGIVEEYYEGIQEMYRRNLSRFRELSAEHQMQEMENLSLTGMVSMADYMYEHYDEFKLILCCSRDTRYGDLADQMAFLDDEATREFAKTADSMGADVTPVPPRLEHILTTGLFTMFFELIVHDVPREEADEYIENLIHFFTNGYKGIMGF